MAPLAGPMVERMFSAAYRERSGPLLNTLQSVFLRTDPQGYAACVAVLDGADFTQRLGAIHCPAIVIRGKQDVLAPIASARALADAMPAGRLVELDGAHFPPIEDAPGFVRAVLDLHRGP